MVTQLLQPQEIEVYYVIPTIRRYLAQYLKGQGMSQKAIAELFMIRESTVSQYINSKRASTITFPKHIEDELRESAIHVKNHIDLIRETQRLLRLIRESRLLCELHRKYSNVKLECDPVVTGCILAAGCQ